MTDRYGHPRQSAFGRRHASAAASVQYSSANPQQHHPHAIAPPPQPAVVPSSSSTAASRRNNQNSNNNKLFQRQLTRRPPPRDDGDDYDDVIVGPDYDGGEEIVVRGVNGEVQVDEPPRLVVDDPDEIVLDMRQENARERQRLADAVKQHQSQQNSVPAQPEELLEAVKASLRAKVAALAEDNWMYEKEEEPHVA